MTPEDREIWGRVSSHFVAVAPERALTFAPVSYIGVAIGLPLISGAQDARDATLMSDAQDRGRYVFRLVNAAYPRGHVFRRIDIRGVPLDETNT